MFLFLEDSEAQIELFLRGGLVAVLVFDGGLEGLFLLLEEGDLVAELENASPGRRPVLIIAVRKIAPD